MNLDSVLSLAGTGLDSVGRRLAVVSQNVANANTPGYAREGLDVSSATAGGVGIGVRIGVVTRASDNQLQAEVFAASASASGQQVRADALSQIDAASGATGSGQDLASLVGKLRDGFSALSTDPSNQTQQGLVVQQADGLARGINEVSRTLGTVRQNTHDGAIADVSAANSGLRKIGDLSIKITQAAARGQSTADLEDQRDQTIQTVADLTGAKFLRQKNGDVLGVAGGVLLPLQADTGPFSLAPAAVNSSGSGAPPLLLDGQDVTSQIKGGQLGAHLDIRDRIVPQLQLGVDRFANNLSRQFSASGLNLFTTPVGSVPPGISAGFASTIKVDPAVKANPALTRDGNVPTGQAGSSTLIEAVLGSVLGSGTGSLSSQARDIGATHASLASDAATQLATDKGVKGSLTAKLSSGVGVSVDTELTDLVRLQNAYAANAKVLSSTQQLWSDLFNAVR